MTPDEIKTDILALLTGELGEDAEAVGPPVFIVPPILPNRRLTGVGVFINNVPTGEYQVTSFPTHGEPAELKYHRRWTVSLVFVPNLGDLASNQTFVTAKSKLEQFYCPRLVGAQARYMPATQESRETAVFMIADPISLLTEKLYGFH